MKHKGLRAMLGMLLLGGIAACDTIPTEFPSWDVTARIPAIRDSLTVGEFMPSGVTIDRGRFVFADIREIGEVPADEWCPSCSRIDGAPLSAFPGFTHNSVYGASIAGEFESAKLTSGTLELSLTHTLPYDLLRSDTGREGEIRIELISPSGSVLAADTVRGSQNPGGPGKAIVMSVDLAGVTVTPGIQMRVYITSFGSDGSRLFDASSYVRYSSNVLNVQTPSVTVRRDSETTVEADPIEFEIDGDLREELLDKIVSAKATLRVDHPFAITGDYRITFYGTHDDAEKGINAVVPTQVFPVSKGNNRATLELNGEQLRTMLSRDGIFIRYRSHFDPSEAFSVSAADRVHYSASMDATLTVNKSK